MGLSPRNQPSWRRPPLTAAHLGPGRGGPERGGLRLIVFRHQLRRLESQTAQRGPCSPLERLQTPGFFPGKVHLGGGGTPSLSPPSLCARHLASHQLSTGPQQTHQRQAGGSIPTHPHLQGTARRNPEVGRTCQSHQPCCLYTK